MSTDAIHLKLLAEPLDFSMAKRSRFQVGIVAINQETKTIDPDLSRARLLMLKLRLGDSEATPVTVPSVPSLHDLIRKFFETTSQLS